MLVVGLNVLQLGLALASKLVALSVLAPAGRQHLVVRQKLSLVLRGQLRNFEFLLLVVGGRRLPHLVAASVTRLLQDHRLLPLAALPRLLNFRLRVRLQE